MAGNRRQEAEKTRKREIITSRLLTLSTSDFLINRYDRNFYELVYAPFSELLLTREHEPQKVFHNGGAFSFHGKVLRAASFS